jgi:hypothetical protein
MGELHPCRSVEHVAFVVVGVPKGKPIGRKGRKIPIDQVKEGGRRRGEPVKVVRGVVAAVLPELESDVAPFAETYELAYCRSPFAGNLEKRRESGQAPGQHDADCGFRRRRVRGRRRR